MPAGFSDGQLPRIFLVAGMDRGADHQGSGRRKAATNGPRPDIIGAVHRWRGGLGGGGGGATAATLALSDAAVNAAAANKDVKVENLRIQISPTITALPSMLC